jgi:hypothetical protein
LEPCTAFILSPNFVLLFQDMKAADQNVSNYIYIFIYQDCRVWSQLKPKPGGCIQWNIAESCVKHHQNKQTNPLKSYWTQTFKNMGVGDVGIL